MLVLRGASFGADTPVRVRSRRGAGSEVRALRSGIAVVVSNPSGRRLRRSNGASDLGGGRIWHARVRHCRGVQSLVVLITLLHLFVCLMSNTQVPIS